MEIIKEIKINFEDKNIKIAMAGWITQTRIKTTEHAEIYINYDNNFLTLSGSYFWYNRDWQKYTYHNALIDALNKYMASGFALIKEIYKEKNNIKRLSKKHNEIVNNIYNNCFDIRLLEYIKKLVNNDFVIEEEKKATEIIENFKKDYEALSENTKKHLAQSEVIITNEEEAKNIIKISKLFDLLIR